MNRKAILVVSFGTSYIEAGQKSIEVIETEIHARFPEYRLYRAWTSERIRRKVEKRDGVHISGVSEALRQMKEEGIAEVLVQATYILPGSEYRKMKEELKQSDIGKIMISAPLLGDAKDCEQVAEIFSELNPAKDKEMFVYMGHGEEDSANAQYARMNEIWKSKGREDLFLGAMEGENGLEAVLEALSQNNVQKITLAPFMVTAGSHAVSQMAGEQEDSWKNLLTRAGYEVECCLKGLGEYPAIRKIFVEHLEKERNI